MKHNLLRRRSSRSSKYLKFLAGRHNELESSMGSGPSKFKSYNSPGVNTIDVDKKSSTVYGLSDKLQQIRSMGTFQMIARMCCPYLLIKNKKKVPDIRVRRENRKKFIVYPEDYYKQYWEALMALVLILTCAVTPIRLAFYQRDDLEWLVVNYIIDFLFFIDIIVIFNSAYYDDNFAIVEDRKTIAVEYAKGWLVIDVLSIFPFAEIAELFNNNGSGGDSSTAGELN